MMTEAVERRAKTVLPIAFIITFIGFLDTHLLVPIIALYASELGASIGVVGLIIGLYSLTNTPANILLGRLIDRMGKKTPLIVGLIGDALSMFLYSLSRLPVHLALVRVFHGVTGGVVGPATMSFVADYSESGRGRVMGYYGMAIAAATLVGYGLGGIIASRFGYKAVFLLGMALLIIGTILGLFLPGGCRRGGSGAESISAGGFEKARDLVKRRGLIISYCSIFAHYFAFGGVVTLLPLYLKGLGMGALHVGILMATFSAVFILVQFPAGTISDRVGRVGPVVSGLALSIVAVVMIPLLADLSLLIALMAMYGAAYGMLFPAVSALVADHTAAHERGMATGIFHALLTAGVAIGAPVMGWVGGMLGVELGLALSPCVLLAAVLVVLGVARRV